MYPEEERKFYGSDDMYNDESEVQDFDSTDDGDHADCMHKEDFGAWQDLDSVLMSILPSRNNNVDVILDFLTQSSPSSILYWIQFLSEVIELKHQIQ